MKTYKLIGLLTAAVMTIGAGCAKTRAPGELATVATTIVPLTSITQNLLAGVANVQSILPPTAEPHDVVLSTGELQILQDADVIVTWGLTLDDWVAKGIAATESEAPVVVATKYLNLTDDQLNDPHAWLSPKRMLQISGGLGADLANQFPEKSAQISNNTAGYRLKLAQLDTQFESLRGLPNRDIVTLHDAFGYLAQDYNLNILATIQDLPEDNPSPDDIARVIDVLKQHPKAALFAESEISPAIIQTVARETGRTIHVLDPLEVADAKPETYISVMEKNLQTLKQALGAAK